MGKDYDAVLEAPFAWLGIVMQDEALCALDILGAAPENPHPPLPGALKVIAQLEAYFLNPKHHFELPLLCRGTPFQERVWRSLREIPPGVLRTYGETARILGSGARAVGNACRANPVPIIIPCHRVVAADSPGGYMGKNSGTQIDYKNWLLSHEKQSI